MTRVKYRKVSEQKDFAPLYSVLSLLSYMLKAPLVKPGTFFFLQIHFFLKWKNNTFLIFYFYLLGMEVVNSLNRQRNALESFLKACIGLEGNSDLLLETRIW